MANKVRNSPDEIRDEIRRCLRERKPLTVRFIPRQEAQYRDTLEAPGKSSPGPEPEGEYEFSEAQNKVLRQLVGMMFQTAALFAAVCVASCAEAIYKHYQATGEQPPDVSAVSDAIDYMFYAYFLQRASESFVKVTTTAGSDISLLLAALNQLYLLFKRMRFVCAIYILKTCALIAIEFPRVKRLFKTPKTNLKSPLAMTANQATLVIVFASLILTGIGLIGIRFDKQKMEHDA